METRLKFLTLICLSLLVFSCSTKKVAISKSVVETKIDSVVVEKKDSVAFQQNAISIKEDIDEIEIVPIDASKPLVIGGKEYFNAAVKIKKTKREVVDSTKIAVAVSDYKQTEVSKEQSTEDYSKSVEKKINYFEYFWLPILLLVLALAYKLRRLLPNPYSIISYICRTLKNRIK
jgi:hypothetical protein